MPSATLYVMLIKASSNSLNSPELVGWIDEIENEYMDLFGHIGASLAHVALTDAPWQFALVFPGSAESAQHLAAAIDSRAPGQTEILIMSGTDLDAFRAARRGA